MSDKYRVLAGKYRDQTVTIVRRNGSTVQVATVIAERTARLAISGSRRE